MKKVISLLLVAVLLLGMLPVAALAAGTQPEADSNGVYQIGTAAELLWFAETVNNGNTNISGVLTADIDLSATTTWPGIGKNHIEFSGFFDGQNHVVTFQNANWGLFGFVMGSANNLVTIKNVRTAGSVKRTPVAHGAGYAHFTNCINRATVSKANENYVGGIVGCVSGITTSGITYSDVLISQCGNEASISCAEHVGGIVGYAANNTRLNGCYNIGNISGTVNVGGLVGYLQEWTGTCEIKNSYNTGRVTGTTAVGGIVGNQYNDVSVSCCYNAGPAYHAIAGNRYNQTATISNTYFLGTASTKVSPDYNQSQRADELTNEIQTRASAVTAAEMASAEFAELLGDAFLQSCPTPVLSWQTAMEHTGENTCDNCSLGSREKEQYDVAFQQHNGYSFVGEEKATQDGSYSFAFVLAEGYEKATNFAVKVNGELLTPASDGKYTVLNVDGPLSVTVLGVQVIPGSHAIQLPADGYGYRTEGDRTVERDADYTFELTFVDGFRAGKDFKVIAQQILSQDLLDKGFEPEEKILTEQDGTYTIPTVQKDYRILVSGVEVVSSGVTATVNFSITEGYNNFHEAPVSGETMIDRTITVPYFDLSLYGLERYYYNPYCYIDEAGNLRGIQQKGTPESAYDKITVMHAFIVATELYMFEYDQAQVGKGTSYKADPEAFEDIISWSQGAGSSFMDFWEFGTNLNYYVNYEYPLAYVGWGSTSDQVLIENGDVLSVHMITGNASGSRFGFFAVNDTNKQYDKGTEIIDSYTLNQGEKVELTLYWTATTADYSTGYETIANKELYWIEEGDESDDIRTWNATKLGEIPPAVDPEEEGYAPVPVMRTNSKGVVTISTAGVEPGTYYLAAPGGWTAGGAVDNDGFKSAGGETGPALFKLTVEPYEGKLGDVNGDGIIASDDATQILRYVAKLTAEINESVADANGDGFVASDDATLISRYVAKLIDSFPAEQTN